MFKDLSVTLYDLFGYLFPGALTLFAILLSTWAIFYPSYTALLYGYDASIITAMLGVAYLMGHVVQAAANKLEDWVPPDASARDAIKSHVAFAAIEGRLLKAFAASAPTKDKVDIYFNICDHANAAAGLTAERDIFMHRKGLYRSTFIALGLVTLGFAVTV